MKKHSKLLIAASLFGNILDHYDTALYIYMAPFIAPLFFPDNDPVVGLIKAYAITSIGIIVRPIGALIFGKLALKHSSITLLAITLCGVAICTFVIGLIPSYHTIGICSSIILVIIRFIQGIFAAGEHTISSLFILDNTKQTNQYGKLSSYYICSTMAGVMLASFAAMIVSKSSHPLFYWRIAFIIGLFTAILGLIIRIIVIKKRLIPPTSLQQHIKIYKISDLYCTNKYHMLKIIILSSFSFVTFALPFIFLNNFIPLITNIQKSELLTHNTVLLLIDIILLPISGIFVDRFNHVKWMTFFAVLLTSSIIPIFYYLPSLSLMQITLVKLWIIIIGVAFAVPLNVLLFKMIKGNEKFLITGFSYAIGTEMLGRSTTTICLSIWKVTNNTVVPGFYIAFICALTLIVLLHELKQKTLT